MTLEKGDLVVCYLVQSSSLDEELLDHGIVLDVNPRLEDVLVLSRTGNIRWWHKRRWRLLQKGNYQK